MNFLKNLYILSEGDSNLDALPEDVIKEIQKNIRNGAKDLDQDWPNALGLVQKAYLVAGVHRPDPSIKNAWKQYEENLQYAVNELAKYRGMDGDWRMSSAVFHEAMEKQHKFSVVEMGDKFGKSHTVSAKSLDDVMQHIRTKVGSMYEVKTNMSKDPDNPNSLIMSFSRWGIRRNYRIKIQQL
jgi:hypothetical protein